MRYRSFEEDAFTEMESLIAGVAELAFWIVMETLPVVCFFTALVVVFAATFGKMTVDFPPTLHKIGWTGDLWITRSPQDRIILSPALGVIVGFIAWAVFASVVIIVHAYRS